MSEITLGDKKFTARALPFGELKKCAPLFNRAGMALAAGRLDEQTMDDMGAVVAASAGIEPEVFALMVFRMDQLIDAFQVAALETGLAPRTGIDGKKGGEQGEALPAASSIGTASTPT